MTQTEFSGQVVRNKKELLEAAAQLKQLGWAMVTYARRVERCGEQFTTDHHDTASYWFEELTKRRLAFAELRRVYLGMAHTQP